MTSITARNAKALTERNGTTLPETKVVAKGNKVVAKDNDPKAVAQGNDQAETPKAPAPAGVPCGCGCGIETNPGRLYKPGHDARHAGQVGLALYEGREGAQDELAKLGPKLQEKANRFADNRRTADAKKAQAARIRKAAAEALKAELASL
jgi:hypothetical protein